MRPPRFWRYSAWLIRDYFLWGGVATFVIMMFVGASLSESLVFWGRGTEVAHPLSGASIAELKAFVGRLLLVLATIGPVIATIGIASRDRRFGYYRLFFSRPVPVGIYYGWAFVVNGAGFMVMSAALAAMFLWLVGPIPSYSFVWLLLLSYLFLGGIVLLLSVLWREDLFLFIATYAASAMSWDVLSSDRPKSWLGVVRPILSLLPPVHRQAELMMAASFGGIPPSDVWWIGGYGTACLILAFIVLRRRQLGSLT